jgi:hypothetical protein
MAPNHVDTHPGLIKVDFRHGSFASRLLAAKVQFIVLIPVKFSQDYAAGEVIATFEGSAAGPKAYSSVQVSKDKHIEVRMILN